MVDIEQENAVFKYAAAFLPKWEIDIVAQFADKHDIFVMKYDPISGDWFFSSGEVYSTILIMGAKTYEL